MSDFIGFVGLGNMGGAMARRLLARGRRLVVYDSDPGAVTRLHNLGAEAATSAREVASRAEIVYACLPSAAACQAVAAEIAKGGAARILIEASTVGQAAIEGIFDFLADRGMALVDAPVSGGAAGAEAGTLTTIVSGPTVAVDAVRPILADVAGNVFVVGERAGLSQVYKMVNNVIGLSAILLTAEAMVAGVKAGADPDRLIEIINASTGRNGATSRIFPQQVLTGQFHMAGPMALAVKDVGLFVELCRQLGTPAQISANVLSAWQIAGSRFGLDADTSLAVKIYEEWAGVEVRGKAAQSR